LTQLANDKARRVLPSGLFSCDHAYRLSGSLCGSLWFSQALSAFTPETIGSGRLSGSQDIENGSGSLSVAQDIGNGSEALSLFNGSGSEDIGSGY